MNYYEKYLKYKTKFLHLKNLQYGGSASGSGGGGAVSGANEVPRVVVPPGSSIELALAGPPEQAPGGSIELAFAGHQGQARGDVEIIEDKYKRQLFQLKCFITGFKQHDGECWNDSIMMFFCNQDEIKEVVQRKLRFLSATEIIQLALLKNRENLLPSLYLEKEFFDTILTNLPDYLNKMKERFNYYYDYYNEDEDKQKIPKYFKGDSSPRLGIECAKSGQKIISAVGSDTRVIVSILIILSCFLLDDIELIFNIKNINKIKREDSNNVIAVYNLLREYEYDNGHASLFYICNGITYHFDDNEPQPKIFDFKSLLNSRITSIENKNFDDDNVFSITYPADESHKAEILKTVSVILIKINEYTPDDMKNKMNTLFYLDYQHYSNIYVPRESRTEKPFELLIDKYLKLGFDINSYSDENGNTLLHNCIPEYDKTNLVRIKFLISKGIDVNVQNGNGDTILHLHTNAILKTYGYMNNYSSPHYYESMVKMYKDQIIELNSILEEILKLSNIRIDIKNYKGELVKNICIKCYSFWPKKEAKYCENCGNKLT